nr:unnamed protein product [Callosobruchus analis]
MAYFLIALKQPSSSLYTKKGAKRISITIGKYHY